MKKISNSIIRKFKPCYDPAEVVKDEDEELPVVDWVQKYRNLVRDKSDVAWLLCRPYFMSDRDMRLFAVWCAREALKLYANPDKRSINACDVAERYANGEATKKELDTAAMDAWAFDWTTTNYHAAGLAAHAASSPVTHAARYAIYAAWTNAGDFRDAQIDRLLTYLEQ